MAGDSEIRPTRMTSVRNRNISVRRRMRNAVLSCWYQEINDLVRDFLFFDICTYVFGLMMLKLRDFRISEKKTCSECQKRALVPCAMWMKQTFRLSRQQTYDFSKIHWQYDKLDRMTFSARRNCINAQACFSCHNLDGACCHHARKMDLMKASWFKLNGPAVSISTDLFYLLALGGFTTATNPASSSEILFGRSLTLNTSHHGR
jgi:hypothetical protein